jgi:hypothetical protein
MQTLKIGHVHKEEDCMGPVHTHEKSEEGRKIEKAKITLHEV